MDGSTLAVLWVLMVAIGAAIGQRKGRVIAGTLFGALLGPLGIILIAAGPNLGPKCPECGGDVVKDATRCKNCGVVLAEAAG